MELLDKVFGKKTNPPLVVVLMHFGLGFNAAMAVAAFFQIAAILLLLFAVAMFAEWRLVQWEQLGCSAYCNCSARLANMTYSL